MTKLYLLLFLLRIREIQADIVRQHVHSWQEQKLNVDATWGNCLEEDADDFSDHMGIARNYPDSPTGHFFETHQDQYYKWSSLSESHYSRQCRPLYRKIPEDNMFTFYAKPFGNRPQDRLLVQLGYAVTDLYHIKDGYSYNESEIGLDETSDTYGDLAMEMLELGSFNCYVSNEGCQVGFRDPEQCYVVEAAATVTTTTEELPEEATSTTASENRRDDTRLEPPRGCIKPGVPSSENCLIKYCNGVKKRGCTARCHSSLILQVELYPKTNTDGRTRLSAIAFTQKLEQPRQMDITANKTFLTNFGFRYRPYQPEAHFYSNDAAVLSTSNALEADKMKGFWVIWHDRNETNGTGPIVEIGNEGQQAPFAKYDISRGLGQASLQQKWHRSWLGTDIIRPKLYKTFKPRYFSLAGVKGGMPIIVRLPCNITQKYVNTACRVKPLTVKSNAPKRRVEQEEIPLLLIIALVFLGLAFLSFIVGLINFKRKVDRRREAARQRMQLKADFSRTFSWK